MRGSKLFIIALILIVAAVSCKRRPLYYEPTEYAELIIDIDWSKAFAEDDKPTGVSVWFYPQDAHREVIISYSANVERHVVSIPVGRYDVVVFNHTPAELMGTIGFRGADRLETLEVYSQHITTTREPTTSRGILTEEPAEFALTIYRNLEVTSEMAEDTELEIMGHIISKDSRTIYVVPELITQMHAVQVEIEGYNNLSVNGVYGELSGLAEGYMVSAGVPNTINARQKLVIWEQNSTSADLTEGEANAEYRTWGLVSEVQRSGRYDYWTGLLELLMRLRDGSTKNFEIHLDSKNIVESGSATEANIELLIRIGYDVSDPIVLPEVEPGPDEETGFDPVVDPWDDEIDVPIIIG